MLSSCQHCPGFVPPNATVCPHCGAGVGDASARSGRSRATKAVETAAKVGGGAVMMMALMACYGGGFDDGPIVDGGCIDDFDCASGSCNVDNGICTNSPEVCNDGFDNDGDGRVDASDLDCGSFGELCGNGFDDDSDGLVDCEDPECTGACGTAEICDNGADDDGDSFIDCADPECNDFCIVEVCDNGVDDDLDGTIDCADNECAAGCPETDCDDGIDNDLDLYLDCEDPGCAADPVCGSAICGDEMLAEGEECDDGNASDGDGCDATCALELDTFCAALPVLPIGNVAGTTAAGSNGFTATCLAAEGLERAYQFTAPSNGTLYAILDADTDLGIYAAQTCGDGAVEIGCANDGAGGELETLQVDMTAATTITVFVDSNGLTSEGPFTIVTSFVAD